MKYISWLKRKIAIKLDIEEQKRHCKLGICDHYTCTEGRNLEEWEYNNPDIAKY